MVITEKYYPYPVLGGKAVAFAEECLFDAKFTALANSKQVVLDVIAELKEPAIEELIATGKARLVCHVECPATAYRMVQDIKLGEPCRLSIEAKLVATRVQANAIVVASTHIPEYTSPSFVGIYKDKKFDIDQGGLLAVADTYSFDIAVRDSKFSDVKSPIQICPDSDESLKSMHVRVDGSEIEIYIPEKQFMTYKAMDDGRSVSASGGRNHDLLIALVVVPALVDVMSRFAVIPLDAGNRDVQEYADDKAWYPVINKMVSEYLATKGRRGDLTTIDFASDSVLEVAQYIAEYPLANAFKRLEEME